MKLKIALIALFVWAGTAFGTTLMPIQLLNPTGSTAGKSIVSTGASSAPAWGGPAASTLTGVTQYNVAMGGATGLSFVAPGAAGGFLISNGASAYPSFGNTVSTLQATSTITPSTTAGIVGTTLGDNANAGSWGECIPAQVLSGSAISLTSGTAANVTSINLPAGDWRIYGQVAVTLGAGTAVTWFAGVPSTTSAPAFSAGSGFLVPGIAAGIVSTLANAIPQIRLNVTTTTTVYLIASSTFSGGTLSAYGYIVGCRGR